MAGAGYPVFIGEGVLDHLGNLIASRAGGRQVAVVTNDVLAGLYGQAVLAILHDAGLQPVLVRMPEGEQHKTLDTVRGLYEQFVHAGLDRHSLVVALGGGVVGDVAGFAAATYLRGVPLVQVPTSLLAMVDASVGGKVGVDLPGRAGGKNLVGAFKQPEFVLADPLLLETLPGPEFRAGLAEIVKHGIIAAPELFASLETRGPRSLAALLDDAVRVKVDIVQADPFERGIRAHLNLGHTFAHAIESVSGYRVRHGEAVATGLVAASFLAQALGMADETILPRVEQLLTRLGLPTRVPDDPAMTVDRLMTGMGSDKKRRDGRLRFVLPGTIGDVAVVDDVAPDLVRTAWRFLGARPETGG
jgi:3-dehydroquinate synthase